MPLQGFAKTVISAKGLSYLSPLGTQHDSLFNTVGDGEKSYRAGMLAKIDEKVKWKATK
jgi:hypothetical protein